VKEPRLGINLSTEARNAWLLLLPSLLLYGLYVLAPIAFSIYLSFTAWDGMSGLPMPLCVTAGSSCFANYQELWQDEVFWLSLRNNLIWLIGFGLSPFVGLAFAFFFHVKGRLGAVYKALLFAPMVFSLVVVGMIWSWFFQPEFGLLEFALKRLGLIAVDGRLELMTSFGWQSTAALIAAAAWPHAAYCMILYLAGLSNLQKNVLEAARLDGANSWQMFRYILVPMLKPATIIVLIVTLIGALRAFDIVAIMTGGGPANVTNTLALYMYQQTFVAFRYGYGASIAVILFLISLGLILSYLSQVLKSEANDGA